MSRRPVTSPSLRERLRTQLADLKMPGALEALDDILRRCDAGELTASDAIAAVTKEGGTSSSDSLMIVCLSHLQ